MKTRLKPRKYADDAPLTKSELATARPMRRARPDIVAAYRAGKFKHAKSKRERVMLSLPLDIADFVRTHRSKIEAEISTLVTKAKSQEAGA